ncbi:hypothetical protein K432DRAFT_417030 [Lepidopterella palustris CBS 459.81]|uniref:Uncharacterized protein n=1 Tax=Lepidopterella palustris CBS 459.81 TaxID=1314670 RepID=A0A8E2EAC3_9PEZI|nr:hypothetical protein K432DRAFT_417030 [Lepidopterella palustris CBS 459.81]
MTQNRKQVVFSAAVTVISPFTKDNAVGVIWAFEDETWIENLAVRHNGSFQSTASIVHEFDATDGLLDIFEIQKDVFVVASANVLVATSTAFPDSAKMCKNDMATWELRGIVWRLKVEAGDYSVAIQDVYISPTTSCIPLGVDGIHLVDAYLYYTNFGKGIVGDAAICQNGAAISAFMTIATMAYLNGFVVTPDGTACVAGDKTLCKVSCNVMVNVLAGELNDSALEGAISTQFGRTKRDHDV